MRKRAAPFAYRTPVFFDDLDTLGMLHNARYALYVERAVSAFYREVTGRVWEQNAHTDSDQFQVVRAFEIEFLAPFVGEGELRVSLEIEHLGETSCTFSFVCTSPDEQTVYARGKRVIVRIDPATQRSAPWSDRAREVFGRFLAAA